MPQDNSDLPESMDLLADVIGRDAVMQLIENFRGIRLYVPKIALKGQKIEKVIGFEKAYRLSRHYGSDSIIIPKLTVLYRRKRDIEITKKKRSGFSTADLAREFDLTERSIYNVLKKFNTAK